MFPNKKIVQQAGRESSQSFSYKLRVSFLVILYSMDEKHDKQGDAFSTGVLRYAREVDGSKILASSYHNRGCIPANVLTLHTPWLQLMSLKIALNLPCLLISYVILHLIHIDINTFLLGI